MVRQTTLLASAWGSAVTKSWSGPTGTMTRAPTRARSTSSMQMRRHLSRRRLGQRPLLSRRLGQRPLLSRHLGQRPDSRPMRPPPMRPLGARRRARPFLSDRRHGRARCRHGCRRLAPRHDHHPRQRPRPPRPGQPERPASQPRRPSSLRRRARRPRRLPIQRSIRRRHRARGRRLGCQLPRRRPPGRWSGSNLP